MEGGDIMSNTQHFGRIVRERREKKKLSLKKVSELCGMGERGLEQIELGDTNPKLSNVLNIAAVLDIDMGELNSCILELI